MMALEQNSPAIIVNGVSKTYRVYDHPVRGIVREIILPWMRPTNCREVHAVDNVSLSILKGEVFGIIGANGSGKTTLLKIIAGLLPADEGKVFVDGDVSPLLALGIGVHSEFSGRENIEYSGLLQGLSLDQIRRLTDDIIDFSEIRDFIDMPFRTYSSGMRARLLFSIAMAVKPEILIVDEALATGDARFSAKAARRIREICDGGTTVVFVSHNVSHILAFCSRAALMSDGKLLEIGRPPDIISAYHQLLIAKDATMLATSSTNFVSLRGSGDLSLEAVEILDKDGIPRQDFTLADAMSIQVHLQNNTNRPLNTALFIGITRNDGEDYVAEVSSQNYLLPGGQDRQATSFVVNTKLKVSVEFEQLLFAHGDYSLWIQLLNGENHDLYSEYRNVGRFFVGNPGRPTRDGSVFLHPVTFTHAI